MGHKNTTKPPKGTEKSPILDLYVHRPPSQHEIKTWDMLRNMVLTQMSAVAIEIEEMASINLQDEKPTGQIWGKKSIIECRLGAVDRVFAAAREAFISPHVIDMVNESEMARRLREFAQIRSEPLVPIEGDVEVK
jgi:hypothetical protein